jgi:hypothetical protein
VNEHDRQNLEFLLNATPEVLTDWFDTMIAQGDDDDVVYALELLLAARNLMELKLLEIFDEEANEDLSQAVDYLRKFQLK